MSLPLPDEGAPPPHALGPVHRFDDAVDRAVDAVRGREPGDRIVYALTELADFSLLWHLLGWTRALADEHHLPAAVRLSVGLGIESVVVNGLLKSVFKRQRPVPAAERPHKLRVPLTTSFPSGHASSAMMAAVLLSDGAGRVRTTAWFALAAAVASSRVHVRIHHASDVAGGALVGLALGTALRAAWRLPDRRT